MCAFRFALTSPAQSYAHEEVCSLLALQVDQKTKVVCQPDGYYGPLTDTELAVGYLMTLPRWQAQLASTIQIKIEADYLRKKQPYGCLIQIGMVVRRL